jgi:SAM-dependent methyltransferase
MKRYADYDPFAWLYTEYWGDEFHSQAAPALDQLILRHLPKRAAVLDLCCGDGRITRQLARRGFVVTGLDGSEKMLAYAKRRLPKAEFLLADARKFRLPARFDAVISTFDSLNHVMTFKDLESVFGNVWACLKPGGLFAFDLNREEAYRELWARTSTGVDREAVSVARGAYDSKRGIATCDVTLFRFDEGWQRSDFRLTQKYHPEAGVLAALTRAGFKAETHDAVTLGMQGDIGVGRTFYLASKIL